MKLLYPRMTSLLVGALLLFSAAEPVGNAQEKKATGSPGFKGFAEVPGAVDMARSFSEDKQAVTVIFRNLDAAVGQRGPLMATRTTTVAIPLNNQDQATLLTQDIRGFLMVEGNARATLLVQAAGKATLVDLNKACEKVPERPKDGTTYSKAKEAAKSVFPPEAKSSQGTGNFHVRIPGTIPKGASYQVTFVLLVERDFDAPEHGGLLVIDTLDVEISKSTACGNK